MEDLAGLFVLYRASRFNCSRGLLIESSALRRGKKDKSFFRSLLLLLSSPAPGVIMRQVLYPEERKEIEDV